MQQCGVWSRCGSLTLLILKICYVQPSVGRNTVSGTIRVPSSALKRYECNGQYDGG